MNNYVHVGAPTYTFPSFSGAPYDDCTIRHMTVPVKQIKIAESWGYLVGTWREANPHLLLFC